MYPACLSDVSEDENYFLRLTRAQLKPHIVALAVSGLNSEIILYYIITVGDKFAITTIRKWIIQTLQNNL